MESISRDIADLAANEKAALETALGRELHANQRLIIRVVEVSFDDATSPPAIEDFAIFSDLSDDDITDLEAAILPRSTSRNIDV